jgi:hypothetical protein
MAVVSAVRSRTVDPHHRQGKFDFNGSNFMSATEDEAQFSEPCLAAESPTHVSPFMKLKCSIEIGSTISSCEQFSMRLFLFYFSSSEPNAKNSRIWTFWRAICLPAVILGPPA